MFFFLILIIVIKFSVKVPFLFSFLESTSSNCTDNSTCFNCLKKIELREVRLKVWLERHIYTKHGIVQNQRFKQNVRKICIKNNFYNL